VDHTPASARPPLQLARCWTSARAAFDVAVDEKPKGRFMIRNGARVVKRPPEGDW